MLGGRRICVRSNGRMAGSESRRTSANVVERDVESNSADFAASNPSICFDVNWPSEKPGKAVFRPAGKCRD